VAVIVVVGWLAVIFAVGPQREVDFPWLRAVRLAMVADRRVPPRTAEFVVVSQALLPQEARMGGRALFAGSLLPGLLVLTRAGWPERARS